MAFKPPFGRLRGNVRTPSTARWKAMADFIFAINEHFRHLLRLRRYKQKSVEVDVFRRGRVTLSSTGLRTFSMDIHTVRDMQERPRHSSIYEPVIRGSVQPAFWLRPPTYYRFAARIELLNAQTILISSCQAATQTRVLTNWNISAIGWPRIISGWTTRKQRKSSFERMYVHVMTSSSHHLPRYWKSHRDGSARSCYQWTFDSHRPCQQSVRIVLDPSRFTFFLLDG